MNPRTCRHACATACAFGLPFSRSNPLPDLVVARRAGLAHGTRAGACCRLGPCTRGGSASGTLARHAPAACGDAMQHVPQEVRP